MPFPAARLTDITVTGDAITGPGMPTVLIANLPASVLGDLVAGGVCTGSITVGSPTVLVGGVPLSRVTSTVVGANTVTGVPLTTAVGPPASVTVVVP